MLLYVGIAFAVITIALYFIYWTDVLFYWSDPLKCPPSVFQPTVTQKLTRNKQDLNDKQSEIKKQAKEVELKEEKFLVIGCGFCGLAICGALSRNGIAYEAAEKNEEIGGNWYNGVYETVHIISSRRTTQYTDYPMPSSYPDFPSAQQMIQYLNQYCDEMKIRERIMFRTSVDHIQYLQTNVDQQQGSKKQDFHYMVQLTNHATGETLKKRYRGVIIANGHHWDMRWPSYLNQESFKGQIIHSKQYKKPDQLIGKKVLVIGGGNSACDIATEAARFAKESHLSIRRGYWFIPRCIKGRPTVELSQSWMPLWLQRIVMKSTLHLVIGSYADYGLTVPDHNLFEHHPTVNSTILENIKLGKIKPHGDIQEFLTTGQDAGKIKMKAGEVLDIDMIVCCTGFHTSIPLLKDHVEFCNDETGYPKLIKNIFVPKRPHFYVSGLGQVRYGAGSLYTSEAEFIAKNILMQDQLGFRHHIGEIWKTFFRSQYTQRTNELTPDILLDPHAAWKERRLGVMLLRVFPLLHLLLSLIKQRTNN